VKEKVRSQAFEGLVLARKHGEEAGATFTVRRTVEGIGVERVWYPVFYLGRRRIGFGFLAPVFLWWRGYCVARDCDVIHAHQCLWPVLSATIAARMRRKPVVCKIGNSGERFDFCGTFPDLRLKSFGFSPIDLPLDRSPLATIHPAIGRGHAALGLSSPSAQSERSDALNTPAPQLYP